MASEATREQVIRKAVRLFPHEDLAGVLALLDDYGSELYHRERERVQLAALKQCDGDLERLRGLMATARGDFRDVLIGAEYPNEFRLEMTSSAAVSEEQLAEARELDRRQYRAWLEDRDGADGTVSCARCGGIGAVPRSSAFGHVLEPWLACPSCEAVGRVRRGGGQDNGHGGA